MRRALVVSVGVALVVATDAAARSDEVPSPLLFVGYSLLIWGVVPVLVTLAVAGVAALTSNTQVPIWLTAVVSGVATAAWISWGVGLQFGGVSRRRRRVLGARRAYVEVMRRVGLVLLFVALLAGFPAAMEMRPTSGRARTWAG